MRYRLIGIYELITGIFGLILIFMHIGIILAHKEDFNSFLPGVVLFGGSIFAGYALYKGYNNAIKYSILLQILQSFSFTIKGYHYLFTCGAFLSVVITKNGLRLSSQIGPVDYLISKVEPLLQTEIRLFAVPLIFLIILLLKKTKETDPTSKV
jgi:hypothetical protein